jgi:two-component system, sensor histidine kinase and response regulator
MHAPEFNLSQRQEKSVVLVVDDNPKNLQLVATVLNPYYRLLLTGSGHKAIEIAHKIQPDLILLDIMMPEISGYEVCEILKNDNGTRHIPVIFLTAKSEEEDIVKAFDVGGADYITKPFKTKELLTRVNTVIYLSNNRKRLRQVIDLVPHRLYAKDIEGNIVLANNAAAEFYQKKVEDILGLPEPALPEGCEYEIIVDDKLCPPGDGYNEVQTCEEHLKFPDGRRRFYQTNKIPFTFSGTKLPALLQISMDVTELKEKQEEINRLNQQLLQHSAYKDKLLSIIAHDLVNLIFSNEIALMLILKSGDTISKEEILAEVDKARRNTSKTLDLLNDLLMWSMAQFKSVTFTPVNLSLNAELRKLAGHMQTQAEAKGVTLNLELSGELQVKADRNMLQTIMRNLVSNAIKFSEPGKAITINAHPEKQKAKISVTDEGIGMSPKAVKSILQRNTENLVSFGTEGEKGTGLGLNLSQEFIEQHGGKLKIKSKPGQGSTFTFTLPLVSNRK